MPKETSSNRQTHLIFLETTIPNMFLKCRSAFSDKSKQMWLLFCKTSNESKQI